MQQNGKAWQVWQNVIKHKKCDKKRQVWQNGQVWDKVKRVAKGDKFDRIWEVWPNVTSVK